MSLSELLLTLFIALLVFGPNKLPMLARHLGKLMAQMNVYKQKAAEFWQSQLNEQQLEDNIKKAKKADTTYQQDEMKFKKDISE